MDCERLLVEQTVGIKCGILESKFELEWLGPLTDD